MSGVRVNPKNYKIYETFMDRMNELKHYCTSKIATMAAFPVKAGAIVQDSEKFARDRDAFTDFLAIPDMVVDVRDYEDDPAYDITGLTNVTIAKLVDTITMIDQSFPSHNDYPLVGQLIDGYWVQRTFTVQQTGSLRASYQAIADTINDRTNV